jgi:hypothetical protein
MASGSGDPFPGVGPQSHAVTIGAMQRLRVLGVLLGIVATGLSAWGFILVLSAHGDTGGVAFPGPAALLLAGTLSLYGATIAVGFGVWWGPVVIALVLGAEGWWLQIAGMAASPWMTVTDAEVLVGIALTRARAPAYVPHVSLVAILVLSMVGIVAWGGPTVVPQPPDGDYIVSHTYHPSASGNDIYATLQKDGVNWNCYAPVMVDNRVTTTPRDLPWTCTRDVPPRHLEKRKGAPS